MNELYLSDFYEMPAIHTRDLCESKPWYELERGIETRRAIGCLAYLTSVSDYVAEYVAGNKKLKVQDDPEYKTYAKQMKSYEGWYKKGFDFEFLDLILEFVTVVGSIVSLLASSNITFFPLFKNKIFFFIYREDLISLLVC